MNKKIALTFLITNLVYSICETFLFFRLNNQIIIDFSKGPPIALPLFSIWCVLPAVLLSTILVGLYWILIIFREKRWISTVFLIFVLLRVFSTATLFFYQEWWTNFPSTSSPILLYLSYFIIACMIISIMFIKNKSIRIYFRLFGILTALAYIIPRIGPYLYDNFSITWLMINQAALFQLCTFVSLAIFVKVWINSKKENNISNLQSPASNL